jgi:hypothetical protein
MDIQYTYIHVLTATLFIVTILLTKQINRYNANQGNKRNRQITIYNNNTYNFNSFIQH